MAAVGNADALTRDLFVRVPPERAFTSFVNLGRWWPREYTWSQNVLHYIGIEPRVGGACFERGPHNFECDWGRVLVWDTPRRPAVTWQLALARNHDPTTGQQADGED